MQDFPSLLIRIIQTTFKGSSSTLKEITQKESASTPKIVAEKESETGTTYLKSTLYHSERIIPGTKSVITRYRYEKQEMVEPNGQHSDILDTWISFKKEDPHQRLIQSRDMFQKWEQENMHTKCKEKPLDRRVGWAEWMGLPYILSCLFPEPTAVD